jgi:hypothetical protein
MSLSDKLKNKFSEILGEDATINDCMILQYMDLKTVIEQEFAEINKKLDHMYAMFDRPITGKTKKTKSNSSGKSYFIDSFVANPEQYYDKLNRVEIEQLIGEHDEKNINSDDPEILHKHAELVWDELVLKDESFVEELTQLAKDADNATKLKQSTKRSSTKAKTSNVEDGTDDTVTPKSKKKSLTTKTKSSKKNIDEDSKSVDGEVKPKKQASKTKKIKVGEEHVDEDGSITESVESKPKKRTTKAKTSKSNVDEESNIANDKDKHKKRAPKTKSSIKTNMAVVKNEPNESEFVAEDNNNAIDLHSDEDE